MATDRVETYDGNGNLVSVTAQEISPLVFNERSLYTKAQQALAVNATYLALATPTVAQNTAQVKALTRECNALIRLLLGSLDDISGT
ncbi:MAG: hypothetical protein H0U18_09945 [Pyrinomonadaceae bacterium]|nr:hypothetical protein [Pyrinomonadaceae bacterium]